MAQQNIPTEFDWNNIGEDGGLKSQPKLKSSFYSENNLNQIVAPVKSQPVVHSPTRQNSFESIGKSNLKVSQSLNDDLDRTSEPEALERTPETSKIEDIDNHGFVEKNINGII